MGGGDDRAIPVIEFPEVVELVETSSYSDLCAKVREACESHGLFLLHYSKVVPKTLRKGMIDAMQALFDLPHETKSRYQKPRPYRSYTGRCPLIPLQESFGIDDADKIETARDFTQLMWPEDNPSFCDTMHEMSTKMRELNFLILRMIFESLGMSADSFRSYVQDSTVLFRLMKYKVPNPPSGSGNEGDIRSTTGAAPAPIGLVAHTDKNAVTILCQNDVQGLEVVMRGQEGNGEEWIPVTVPPDAFIVIVGDALKAWSNGRLHAVKHRVVVNGDKERYSCAFFSIPKDGATVSVPTEFVAPDRPLRYRPFKYSDYISYFTSNIRDDALEIYAGV